MQVEARPVQAETAHNNPSEAKSATRLPQIDVLRGVACIWVLFHHSYNWLYPSPNAVPDWIFSRGYLGVNLFMVLSGFCLARPIMLKGGWLHGLPPYWSFMKRRAIRILPPYLGAFFLFLGLIYLRVALPQNVFLKAYDQQAATAPGFWAHLFMIENFDSNWVQQVSGSMWSLALEFQFYLCFVLLAFWFARYGLKTLIFGTFAVSLAWEAYWANQIGQQLPWQDGVTHQVLLPGALAGFVAGMGVAQLVSDGAWDVRANRWKWVALGLAAAGYLVFFPRFAIGQNMAGAVAFGVLTLVFASLSPKHFEQWKPLVALEAVGIFSYSIYLVHQPLVNFLVAVLVYRTKSILAMRILLLPMIVLFAYVFHIFLEKPFMRKRPATAS